MKLALIFMILILSRCGAFIDFQFDAIVCDPKDIGKLYCVGDTKYWCTLKLQDAYVTCKEYQKCNTESDGEYFCTNLIPEAIAEQWGIQQCCVDVW